MHKVQCPECGKSFNSEEALGMHKRSKHSHDKEPKIPVKQKKKIRNWIIFIVIIGLIVFGISFAVVNKKTLPPISDQGHIEENPPSHVMREPMNILVQKHMLEHADGSGPQGIIINYNCIDYQCSNDLIPNLEAFAEEYPANVYIAPFPKMDAKIALTRLGKIKILDEYNEETIRAFIEGRN